MSLRLEMLQVARLAPRLLGDAAELVTGYLQGQLAEDGGFRDRAGRSDLYYTVFGIEGLLALRADLPAARIAAYLRGFGTGEGLDLVHLSCLARCWAGLPPAYREQAPREGLLAGVERYRSADGAYDTEPGSESGSAYGCFMAFGLYQDLGDEPPDPGAMLACLNRVRTADGGYANEPGMPVGLTPPTAAAATLVRRLGGETDPGVGRWLLTRCHPEGGFFATPLAPIPDLLSTATALHALAGLKVPIDAIKEPCLDFLDTLWTSRGGFYGSWADDELDCEYTYYGLLALGHLSL